MTKNGLITMTKKEARRYKIICELTDGKLDGTEAAKQLNLSVRHVKRLKKKVKKKGIEGVIHGNRGKTSHNKTDPQIIKKTTKLLNKIYSDFNPLLAQEHLRDDHQIELSLITFFQT